MTRMYVYITLERFSMILDVIEYTLLMVQCVIFSEVYEALT